MRIAIVLLVLSTAAPALADTVCEQPQTDVVPTSIVQPVYPRRAQTRGIEGDVLFEIGISSDGAVTDATVIEAMPPGIFAGQR